MYTWAIMHSSDTENFCAQMVSTLLVIYKQLVHKLCQSNCTGVKQYVSEVAELAKISW